MEKEAPTPSKELILSNLKKVDDFNTQILTSVGTYVSMITSDTLPNSKQIKQLIASIDKPMEELMKLSQESQLADSLLEQIQSLQLSKEEISSSLSSNNEISHEMTDKVVHLYHTTSDIDNLIFDFLSEE